MSDDSIDHAPRLAPERLAATIGLTAATAPPLLHAHQVQGARLAAVEGNVETRLLNVTDAACSDLDWADAIALGSPVR